MRKQSPPLGGDVGLHGQPSDISYAMAGEYGHKEQKFPCVHRRKHMRKDYLVWHMNTKYVVPYPPSPARCANLVANVWSRHKKVAVPGDTSIPPGVGSFRDALDHFGGGSFHRLSALGLLGRLMGQGL